MEVRKFRKAIKSLQKSFSGDLHTGDLWRIMYSTDASAYREVPSGVAIPRNNVDLRALISFSRKYSVPLIPRTAGTSLAGQVVGKGLIVDVSRYMTEILEVNPEEHWVRVQPGVILDELNKFVEPYGLFFGPETSTSSRCMIGGMVGNNSCGSHSVIYGSTRDHVISVKAILSDGSEVEFKELSTKEYNQKLEGNILESSIYRTFYEILSDRGNQQEIRKEFPKSSIHRRNTGYALDIMLETDPFTGNGIPFNLSKLLAGSEGTLAFSTEIKLNLVPLPPKQKGLICVHCNSVSEALQGNLIALKYNPGAVELMDKAIMDCTKDNITQRKNRFFIEGDPGAILIIEFARDTKDEIIRIAHELENEIRSSGFGFHFPVIFPPDVKKVWDLRKAGLGVLSNYPGDRKPVPVTEDTAVNPEDLPNYINEFREMLKQYHLECVYYAHVGSGELHLRPVLNLKDPDDVELFHKVALETATLVKKYRGSLSGEHGDGRLRGEFIPLMIGERNYNLIKKVKKVFDPQGIFNPNKITDTPKMNSSLRFEPGQPVKDIPTLFDFSKSHGILRAAEQCNGSGDCRNTFKTGAGMCPSYQAMKDENTTTRARANILREFLTQSPKPNPFDHKEIYDVMDLCLSCKACKSECPSNVDITKLKAEFLQHYYDANGIPIRAWLIANITLINGLGSYFPRIFNFLQTHSLFSGPVKKILGFAPMRQVPLLYKTTLKVWLKNYNQNKDQKAGKVFLFADEFSNFNDVEIGIKAVKILNKAGYEVEIPDIAESGRTFLSKGLVRKAKKIANKNINNLKDLVSDETPFLGIEPSAILTFRDEYPDLADPSLKEDAMKLARNAFLFDEFFVNIPVCKNRALTALFTTDKRTIRLHGHCQQKAVASMDSTMRMLSIPENFKVDLINSGCCGMAGSFGYEKEHYDLSMKIGELGLFPEVRKADADTIISAPGTSCRHQIKDGTGRIALHPIEVLFNALI
ncbi:MAG: FAD-linked oxidase C-terminal domain-containing protein [Bacteroidales bacterium]|jgi:FAD/FMN-containing dehydrogenase/Fe-S oxidoreductase